MSLLRRIAGLFLSCTFLASGGTASGLVAYYPMSGNANDASGNGNTASIVGATPTTDRAGCRNEAYSFNGSSNYLLVADNQSLHVSALTVAAWVYFSAIQSQNARIAMKELSSYGPYVSYGIDGNWGGGGHFAFEMSTQSMGLISLCSKLPIIPGQWYHVAGTYDGASAKLYVNGNLDTAMPMSGAIAYTSWPFDIGGDQMRGIEFLQGKIDEVRVYDRALTTAEIDALLFDSACQASPPPPSLIPVASPTFQRTPLFSWHPSSFSTSYTLEIDTLNSFASPLIHVPTNDTFFSPVVNLPIATIYWRVMGNNTVFSQSASFVESDDRVPLLIPYQPKLTLDHRPVLRWYSVPGGSPYTICVTNLANVASPLIVQPVADTSFSQYSVDLPNGPVFWKVKSSLLDVWSFPDTFTIVSSSTPFLYRFNGTLVQTNQPIFRWKPVPGAASYRVEVGQDPSFAGCFIIPTTDTVYQPLVGLSAGTWYWRADCDLDYSAYSPADSLVIQSMEVINAVGPLPQLRLVAHSGIWAISEPTGFRTLSARVYRPNGALVARIDLQSEGSRPNNEKLVLPISEGAYLVTVIEDGKRACFRILASR